MLSVRTSKDTDTSEQTLRSSPVRTHSMTTKMRKPAHKRQLISGQPSKFLAPNYMFQVCRHILWKHCHRIYIKCRVKECNLAYITFNRVKDLNAHHWLYHPNSLYKCRQCKKTVHTPSTWRFHQYCQCPKLHNVVLLHCGCLSLIPFIEFRIWNNSSSSDVLNVQASISISPKYVSKSKTTSHCHLLLHDCTNVAV